MYDDIVVATDGEPGAAAALAAAVDLAVIHEATLHGVFVLDPRIYTAYSGDEYVDDAEGPEHGLLEVGEEALAEVTMSADAVGVAHETHLPRGRPAQQIIAPHRSMRTSSSWARRATMRRTGRCWGRSRRRWCATASGRCSSSSPEGWLRRGVRPAG
jgi:hypothetical protein